MKSPILGELNFSFPEGLFFPNMHSLSLYMVNFIFVILLVICYSLLLFISIILFMAVHLKGSSSSPVNTPPLRASGMTTHTTEIH